MPSDKWNIPFFYPTKQTAGLTGKGSGFYWTQNNNVHKDDDYEGTGMLRIGKEHDSSDFKVLDSSTGEWQFPFNFDSGDGLSLSGPTGHHSGGETHGCEGFTYMINVSLEDNPPKFRFRKETYHVQYDNDPVNNLWTHPNADRKIVGGGWFGYGWVAYNKKDGRAPGKDSRIMECWWNNDPVSDITNWKMLKRLEDKGKGFNNWGVAATCDGEAYQVGTWSNIQFRFKVDASDFSLHPLKPEMDSGSNVHSIGEANMSFADSEARGYGYRNDMPRDIEMKCLFRFDDTSGKCRLKNVSIREIDPSLSFDDNTGGGTPEQPPVEGTTTIQGTFKVQWDVNNLRTSPCAGAGSTVFYSKSADNDRTMGKVDSITRVAEQALNSSSEFVGKKVVQLDVPLKKVGLPAAANINAKIWSSGGSVIYTSPTNIADSSLTTSYVTTTFDFSTNTHVGATGDKIGIQYDGSDDSNYVVVGYQTTDLQANSDYTSYYSGAWETNNTKDAAFIVWQ